MVDAHEVNIGVHVVTGVLALLLGVVPLLSRKGGVLHRWSGRATSGLGFVVLSSAAVAVFLFDPPGALAAATLTAGYQYASGLRALAITHRGPEVSDLLLALTGLGLAGFLALQMGKGTASWTPVIGYSTVGYLVTVTVYDLSRPLWLAAWRRIRPLDHGLKMTGFYFALLSAGSGNLLERWQPWSQVIPSAAGLFAMAAFLTWYSFRPIRLKHRETIAPGG